jgi:hypothetical protein
MQHYFRHMRHTAVVLTRLESLYRTRPVQIPLGASLRCLPELRQEAAHLSAVNFEQATRDDENILLLAPWSDSIEGATRQTVLDDAKRVEVKERNDG